MVVFQILTLFVFFFFCLVWIIFPLGKIFPLGNFISTEIMKRQKTVAIQQSGLKW
jgi:ATP/ADP translocase